MSDHDRCPPGPDQPPDNGQAPADVPPAVPPSVDETLVSLPKQEDGRAAGWLSKLLQLEHPNHPILLMTAAVTVYAAILALLQVDVNNRFAEAGREGQRYALHSLQVQIGGLMEYGHEQNVYRTYLELMQLADVTTLYVARAADETEGEAFLQAAERLWTTAASLAAGSRWLPPELKSGQWVIVDQSQHWLDDVITPALLDDQLRQTYAEIAAAWNSKGNAYRTILTLVAVTLFLNSLALTVEGWLKWGFVGLGALNIAGLVGWMLVTLWQPVPRLSMEAIRAHVAGATDVLYAATYEFANRHEAAVQRAERAIVNLDQALSLRPDYADALGTRAHAYALKAQAWRLQGKQLAEVESEARKAIADYRRALALKPDNYEYLRGLGSALNTLRDYRASIEVLQRALEVAPKQQLVARVLLAIDYLGLGQPEQAMAEARQAVDYVAAHPTVVDNIYFRDIIRTLRQVQAIEPQPGLSELELFIKQAFVSLYYRKTQQPGFSAARLSRVSFCVPPSDQPGPVPECWPGEEFPWGVERVAVEFDYLGMAPNEQLVMKVYVNGQEDLLTSQAVRWNEGASGRSRTLMVELPVKNARLALVPGRYDVELYVESNLRASGVFTITGF